MENLKSQISNLKNKEKFNKGELENPGWVATPEKDLPVELPFIKNFKPLGKGESPLAEVPKFYKVRCPKCGGEAHRETDVSDTFLDSAWYYYRYIDAKNSKKIFAQTVAKKWLPVSRYMGGFEHAVLHLLYTRFITKVFYDWKFIGFDEPFKIFRAHGHITKDGAKMSKSRGNVVNPDEYIKKFGADALRMYLMFIGPFEQGGDFRDEGIRGITRFLERVWRLGQNLVSKISNFQFPISKQISNSKTKNSKLEKLLHQSIKKITEDIENLHYNTAISQLMILLNEIEEIDYRLPTTDCCLFLKLLAPFAPHITEELYQQFFTNPKSKILNPKQIAYSAEVASATKAGQNSKFKIQNSIHLQKWPKYAPKKIQEKTFELVVQINGKVRDVFSAPLGISEENAKKIALEREKIKNYLADAGKSPQKIIFVPDKLINIVI